MLPILLQAAANTCSYTYSYGGVNTNDWIGINGVVILVSIAIAAVLYILSNFLPTVTKTKLQSVIKFEYVELGVSVIIIVIFVVLASFFCNITVSLTQTDPFTFATGYVGDLLFVNGTGIMTDIYTMTAQYFIDGQVAYAISGASASATTSAITRAAGSLMGSTGIFGKLARSFVGLSKLGINIGPSLDMTEVYGSYVDAMVTLSSFVVMTFSMLLLQWLAIPFIKATALVIVLPAAIIMRSFSFMGPRLREASDLFLAAAIGLYFIYPMTFVLDNYIMQWTYCSGGLTSCNPYTNYLPSKFVIRPVGFLTENTITSNTFGGVSLPINYFGSVLSAGTGIPGLNIFTDLLSAPSVLIGVATDVAIYMFQGMVLIAVDIAITIAFIASLSKGLTAAFSFMRGGEFW
ncbi:MAG: hypothetical protein ACP5MK_00315 [Candidatus Micrarchaeia archaeon]